ncbi:Auxin-responsive protein SAUR32 [Striga hermonthica]|uniref:Auxin-responsive protein SAUR32 n=1 Tax=Striga hermonthica TaxID=68872 RepID=A0A9N7RCZ9_STRHE|nr:Auxin-responsive protein SAUR32 [Striga hermonthica]
MSNIPKSLTDAALSLFALAISASDPWPFSSEEERRRFVIPVAYVNHPLFARLLGEAEEEYGFEQEGPINIPCHVEEFCHVKGLIRRETTTSHHHHHGGGGHHHQFLCFKA